MEIRVGRELTDRGEAGQVLHALVAPYATSVQDIAKRTRSQIPPHALSVRTRRKIFVGKLGSRHLYRCLSPVEEPFPEEKLPRTPDHRLVKTSLSRHVMLQCCRNHRIKKTRRGRGEQAGKGARGGRESHLELTRGGAPRGGIDLPTHSRHRRFDDLLELAEHMSLGERL
eukprot:1827384-Rhodomonas_salina.6